MTGTSKPFLGSKSRRIGSQRRVFLDESSETGAVQLLAFVLARTAQAALIGVVSDDQRVRTTAAGLRATVTGTIGIIVWAVAEGLEPEAGLDVLDRVDSHGLHLTGSLRVPAEDLIEAAGEEGVIR